MDRLKSLKLLTRKKNLLEIHEGQAMAVQGTVKTEMKSWTDIVKKNNNVQRKNLTGTTVKHARAVSCQIS